jgi:AcrR family transcriptional regulator
MTRIYRMKRRAERREETRRRIVDAAIELHQTKGPARTTLADIAKLAGVQRHTLYAHFPEERELYLACSGLYMQRNPLPDPADWKTVRAGEPRLRRGLAAIYAYYEANEAMIAAVLRDADVMPLAGEVHKLRTDAAFAEMRKVLGEGLRGSLTAALLELALSFHTWRLLVRQEGLSSQLAADAMARIIHCAG